MGTLKLHTEHLSLAGIACLLQATCQAIREIRERSGESPASSGQQQLALFARGLTTEIYSKYNSGNSPETKAQAILVLMDTYEIFGEEPILQYALPQAEMLLPDLEATPLKCKLLCYCYHYTEDTECAREALNILSNWDKTPGTPEVAEARQCCNELI